MADVGDVIQELTTTGAARFRRGGLKRRWQKKGPAMIATKRPRTHHRLHGRIGVAAGAAALCASLLVGCSPNGNAGPANSDEILVGSILDGTGVMAGGGIPMQMATKLAVQDINQSGGVLGKQLKLIEYDAQSQDQLYHQYATKLATQDHVVVVQGGFSSSSREAIRPILHDAKILYFYNEMYEGGVCDRNMFSTGSVPSQITPPLVDYVMENWGKRVYVIAADYNYGHIGAQIVQQTVKKNGGEVLGEEYLPLTQTNYSSTIGNIEKARPDAVVSLLVGTTQEAFYRQFAASGLKDKFPIAAVTMSQNNEQVSLTPDQGKGIAVALPNFEELDTPANKAFVKLWRDTYGDDPAYLNDPVYNVWMGWHIWAKAVEKAGTTDRDKVVAALESGITYDAPEGTVAMDPATHQLVQNVSLALVNDKNGFDILSTMTDVQPSFEQSVCNLIEKPETNEQFVPEG